MRARTVALATCILLGAVSAGCAESSRFSSDGPGVGGGSDRLSIEPVVPEEPELTVARNETVTFVVECEPPGPPEEVVVEWEHAIRDERVVDDRRDFQSSENRSAFTVTFGSEPEHVVTAVCTSEDDRTSPQLWNVTVRSS